MSGGHLRSYVEAIAHFFGNAKVAIDLLEDYEYDVISAEATRWYYDSIHIYPLDGRIDIP